jgi:predicted lysophospholipase L1 biosynthesis ABC-type transport system permease subunit
MKGNPALFRIAWREAWRHRRRSALVIALVALPVAVTAGVLTGLATIRPTGAEKRVQSNGAADLIVDSRPDELPAGSRIVPATWDTSYSVIVDDRAPDHVYTWHTDPGDPIHRGKFRLEEGRYQRDPSEATISPALADELDIDVGDTLELYPSGEPRQVVGLVSELGALRDPLLFLLPDGRTTRTWRVDLPAGTPASPAPPVEAPDEPGDDPTQQAAEVSVAYLSGVFVFIWTGVVAAAALSIGFRRQLREVGLLSANGADRRQVRRVLLAYAGTLGLAGSLIGVVVGSTAARLVVVRLEDMRVLESAAGPLRLPWLALGGTVLLGVACAVVAGLRPAARAARIPTTAALQGRVPRATHHVRSVVAGMAISALGVALITYGATRPTTGNNGNISNALIAGGTALVALAAALLNRLTLAIVAWLARRSGLSLRFAARDANLNAHRTGPAVVASMLALAATAGALVLAATYDAEDGLRRDLSGRDQQLLVSASPDIADAPRLVGPIGDAIADALPGANVDVATSTEGLDIGQGTIYSGSLYADVDLQRRPRPLDVQRIRAAVLRELPAVPNGGVSLYVDTPSDRDQVTPTLASVAGGSAVSLLVLGLVAALARSETRHELATLHALGISPRRRRRLSGAAAGVLALVAGALAIPAGVVPAVAFLQARYSDPTRIDHPGIVIPWPWIIAVIAGTTLTLTIGAWLTAGEPQKRAAPRQ